MEHERNSPYRSFYYSNAEKQAYEDLQKQLAVAERELKAAADLVGTAERVFGKTFVQDIIDRDEYQKAAKYLPNGAFTPNGQFLG